MREASQAKPSKLGVGQKGGFSHNAAAKTQLLAAAAAGSFQARVLKMSASSCIYELIARGSHGKGEGTVKARGGWGAEGRLLHTR